MKKVFVIFLCFVLNAQAQSDFGYYTDKEQERIEGLDGAFDGKINISNKAFNQEATFVYFDMVDSLQIRIDAAKMDDYHKKNMMQGLMMTLREVNGRTYELTTYYKKLLTLAFQIVTAVENKNFTHFLYSEPIYAIKNIYFIKHVKETPEFLSTVGKIYPEEVLKVLHKFKERTYKDSIVTRIAITAPTIAKKYLIGENDVKSILQRNVDIPHIKALFEIFNKYGVSSNSINLIDDIVAKKLTIDQADLLTYNKRAYLQRLIEVRNSRYALCTYSLDMELHTKSLEYVRVINDLHDEKNMAVRFAGVKGFRAKELYTLMVYSQEEIFTSTFNGLFERLIAQMKVEKKTGYELLDSLNYNKFRSFIKLCAGFNTLKAFLGTMDFESIESILYMFTGDLDQTKGDLTNAVDVADSFGSLRDSSIISAIEMNVEEEYRRVEYEKSKQGLAIYGLLKSLFVKQNTVDSSWFESVTEKYKMEPIDVIKASLLFDKDTIHRQLHFFYDDKDGEASFASFINTFKIPGFKVTDKERVVFIESTTGRKVIIMANKPKFEYDGQAELINYIDSAKVDIHLLVHRGHSYYAMNTVDHLTSSCKVVFLGSCGGYHNLSEVLDRSPNVHIISTKQIGTMFVNNPLIKIIATNLRDGKDLQWVDIWNSLEQAVKKDTYANSKFQDYIPPHRNLGAIFMQAFRKMAL